MLNALRSLLNKSSAFFPQSLDRVRLGGFGNMLGKILKYKTIILSAIALIILLAITLIQVQQQQTTKQRAGNEGIVSISIDPPIKSVGTNETFTTTLNLNNTEQKDISAVEFNVSYNSSILELVSFNPSTITSLVPVVLSPVIKKTDIPGVLRYLAINPQAESINSSVIELGTLTFKGIAQGTGNVTFDGIQITASETENLLPNDPNSNKTGEYIIKAAVGTPTPILSRLQITGYVADKDGKPIPAVIRITSNEPNTRIYNTAAGYYETGPQWRNGDSISITVSPTDSNCTKPDSKTFTITSDKTENFTIDCVAPPTPTQEVPTATPAPFTAPASCPAAPVSSQGKFMIYGYVDGTTGTNVTLSGHILDFRSTDKCGMYYFPNLESSNYNVSANGKSESVSELTENKRYNF